MKYRMVTANRLSDGAVVYMDGEGNWSTDIGQGKYVPAAGADALIERAADGVARQIVVAPYAIDVSADGGGIMPLRFREQIRANGPTVRLRA